MLVFIAEDVLNADESLLKRAMQFLPKARLAYAKKYRKKEDQALCVYSYLLLRHAMREGYQIRRLPAFNYSTYGKPSFDDFPLKFNMSHCKKGVCCAVSTHEVGVDMQNTEDHRVMRHVMTDSEQLLIAQSDSPDETFTRLWAIKESYFKMLGIGLCEQMRETDFSSCLKGTSKNPLQASLQPSCPSSLGHIDSQSDAQAVMRGALKTTSRFNNCLIHTFHGEGYHLSVSSKADEQVDMVFVDIHNRSLYA
jgi:4'-phosphopantetheinyl transferase